MFGPRARPNDPRGEDARHSIAAAPTPFQPRPPPARALALSLTLAATACDRDATKAAPPRPLVLVVSADTAGWITPCGCTSNQSGGLPRRGTYLSDLRRSAEFLYADAGGAAGPSPADYQKLKFEAILAGEMKMGVAAHNLGGSEAAFGPDYLAAPPGGCPPRSSPPTCATRKGSWCPSRSGWPRRRGGASPWSASSPRNSSAPASGWTTRAKPSSPPPPGPRVDTIPSSS